MPRPVGRPSRRIPVARIGRGPVLAWVLACALAGTPRAADAAPGDERARIAILPIVVYSIGEDDYLQLGLGDMLASRIGRDGRLSVVQVREPEAATTDADAARDAAEAAGADFVLFGSFTRFGEGASLDLHCLPLAENGLGDREVFIQSGTLAEIIPKLDPLAEKIARYVSGTSGPRAASVEGNGTASPGLEELRSRVEALEREVFVGEPGVGTDAPAAASTGGAPAAEATGAGEAAAETSGAAEAPGPSEAAPFAAGRGMPEDGVDTRSDFAGPR